MCTPGVLPGLGLGNTAQTLMWFWRLLGCGILEQHVDDRCLRCRRCESGCHRNRGMMREMPCREATFHTPGREQQPKHWTNCPKLHTIYIREIHPSTSTVSVILFLWALAAGLMFSFSSKIIQPDPLYGFRLHYTNISTSRKTDARNLQHLTTWHHLCSINSETTLSCLHILYLFHKKIIIMKKNLKITVGGAVLKLLMCPQWVVAITIITKFSFNASGCCITCNQLDYQKPLVTESNSGIIQLMF